MPEQDSAPPPKFDPFAIPDVIGQTGQTLQAFTGTSDLRASRPDAGPGISDGGVGAALGLGTLVSGGYNIWKGLGEMTDATTRSQGELDVINGGLGVVQGGSTMVAPWMRGIGSTLNGLVGSSANFLSGGIQLVSALADGQQNGFTGDNTVGGLTGIANLIAGAGGGLSSALTAGLATGAEASVGAILASGAGAAGTGAALGLSAGKAWNDFTEDHSRGRFGVDARGNERTAQGAAVDTGVSAMNWTIDTLMGLGAGAHTSDLAGTIVGGGVSAVSGIANVAGNTLAMAGEGLGHTVAGGFDMLRHWVE